MAEITITIKNKVGLHARPASLFVQAANKYKSDIRVTNTSNNTTANAKSILNVLTLGANQGCEINMKAEGEDADEALAALKELFDTNFGEKE
jgi:phosphotransferase system HPr (HPr) family protein